MTWQVVLLPSAESSLANIWASATSPDRAAITAAASRIDQELRRGADRVGEDYYGDRIYQFGPLAAAYALIPDDCMVKITRYMRIKG